MIRFNQEFIEQDNMESFKELVSQDVINHSAPAGSSAGPDVMIHFLQDILKTGFPDLRVEILDQIAERDLVTTRKMLHATHTGVFMDIPPSGKRVTINVIDIIRLKNGQYVEHWGLSNLSEVITLISGRD